MSEPRIYRIIRFRMSGRTRTLRKNVTLAEARAHCSNPETSSSTCSRPGPNSRLRGRWFDGYDYMPGCKPDRED